MNIIVILQMIFKLHKKRISKNQFSIEATNSFRVCHINIGRNIIKPNLTITKSTKNPTHLIVINN